MRKTVAEPATKGDVRAAVDELARATKKGFDQTATKAELQSLKELIITEGKNTRRHFSEEGKATRRHFDVVAENIHRDVAAANKDEISLIKDQKIPALEKRVEKLEQAAIRH